MKIKDYEYERREGRVIRFPILETDTELSTNILKVCAIGEVINKSGEKVDAKDLDKAIKKLQKTLKDVETVNVLFVVDGTEGMDNTLKQISKSIDVGTKSLKDNGKDIKMGAVVYRNNAAGKKKIEIKSLRKPADISKYLKSMSTDYEFQSEESLLFDGLKAAIENAGLKRKQTNIIMVFGREGNADNDLQKKDIVDLVANKNCHIMAMQVDNKDSDIYDEFQYQFQDIILDAATKRYQKYDQADGGVWKPRFDEAYTGNNEYQKFKLKNTSAIGTLIYPSAGREMSLDELLNETVDVIKNIERNVGKYAKRLKNMIDGIGTGTTGFERFDPAVSLLLDDLTKGEMNAVNEDNFQGSKVGYIVLKRNNNSKHEMYEYALFLDNAQLSETTTILDTFTNKDLTHDELLTLIDNTWRTVLREYEGVKVTEYEDLTLEQIHEKVFGLPVQSAFLKEIKLKNIKDMPYEQANNYIEIMTNSHSRLNNILRTGENHPFSFENDENIYYWILERELP